jgi:hypothetical protein
LFDLKSEHTSLLQQIARKIMLLCSFRRLGVEYAYKVLAFVFIYGFCVGSCQFLASYFLTSRIVNIKRVCLGPTSVPGWFQGVDSNATAVYGYLSVIIYIVVYFAFRFEIAYIKYFFFNNRERETLKKAEISGFWLNDAHCIRMGG